ncbi:uncharacterized protein LOC131237239 isoform X2 [Magnolia sinica]|nr:uncharacterized protein LOC131237239 isoform X2 [Magnolia sinica]
METGGACHEDDAKSSSDMKIAGEGGCSKSPGFEVSPREGIEEGNCEVDPAESKMQHSSASRCTDISWPEIIDDASAPTSNQDPPQITSNRASANGSPGDMNALGSSLLPNTLQESSSVADRSSECLGEGTNSVALHNSLVPTNGKTDDRSSDVLETKDINDDMKEMNIKMNIKEGSLCRVSKEETCAVSTSSGLKEVASSSSSPANAEKCVTGPLSCNIDENEGESCARNPVSPDLLHSNGILGPQHKSGPSNYKRSTIKRKSMGQDGEFYDKVLLDFASCSGSGPETSSKRKDSLEKGVNNQKLVSKSDLKVRRRKGPVICSNIFKAVMNAKESNEMGCQEKLEMEFDYGVDDALEVARQVAKEVEREVVDYIETFCTSSSEKSSEGETLLPGSPDSVKIKQDEPMMEPLDENESLSGHDLADDGSSGEVKRLRISNIISTEQEGYRDVSESPHSTAIAQESVDKIDKGRCNFDLNEDAEEIEFPAVPVTNQPITSTATIPVSSALEGPSGSAAAALHFEGELGWKRSASTSSFHPASPQRTPDGENVSMIKAGSNFSKQRRDFLKIDLNVAEGDDDAAVDLISAKNILLSSGLPDSSVEVNSRKADRLYLDLNRLGDNEDACPYPSSDWKVEGRFQYHQNSNCSRSPASASSLGHPSLRNFDLNNNPSFFDPRSSHDHQQSLNKSLSQDVRAYENLKLDNPIVSIMGSRMDINRTRSFLANEQGVESSTVGLTLARFGGGSGAQPVLAYEPASPATFGYNGLAMGLTMPLPPQFYGPGGSNPYLDSRGATVVPQVMGSTAAFPQDFSRPPFLMNLMSSQSGLSGIGISRPGIDLNSGMTSVDSESRGVGSLRQLLFQGHSGLEEERMKSSWQPDAVVMPVKQKEPECGWGLNMIGYK